MYIRDLHRALFQDNSCYSWIVFNPRGKRPAALDAIHVSKVMIQILSLPIPRRDEPAPVSGEFMARF